tara:strand:- start:277 stop:558 length:282 start_codon:yes stop_codon:yes gene_type:complete
MTTVREIIFGNRDVEFPLNCGNFENSDYDAMFENVKSFTFTRKSGDDVGRNYRINSIPVGYTDNSVRVSTTLSTTPNNFPVLDSLLDDIIFIN